MSLVATAACAAVVAATVPAAGAATAADASAQAADLQLTPFALDAMAYGTKISVDLVPVESSRTAQVVVGCTRDAGIDRHRGVDSADLAGLGSASGIATRTWTTANGGVVTSHARSAVANLTLGDAEGRLGIRALVVKATAWHDSSGFHRSTSLELSGLTGRVEGVPVADLPDAADIEAGDSLSVGVLDVRFGARKGAVTRHSARASTTGLVVDLLDDTRVDVAHAQAGIDSNTPGGLLSGRAQSARGTGLVETNNIVKKSVPCTGTGGEWRTAAAADTDLLPSVDLGAATVGALGDQLGDRHAVARTRAKVASLALFGDDLVVTAIRSQANVTRQGSDWIRTAKGTDLGGVTVDGVQQPIPAAGESLVIDGVARITPGVVHKSAHAITVVGLQVKLLGGADAGEVLNISQSNARVAAR